MDSWGDFFAGMIVAGLVIAVILLTSAGIRGDATVAGGEAALLEAGIDCMLSEMIGSRAILFATNSGRIVYYDGALFKEME